MSKQKEYDADEAWREQYEMSKHKPDCKMNAWLNRPLWSRDPRQFVPYVPPPFCPCPKCMPIKESK